MKIGTLVKAIFTILCCLFVGGCVYLAVERDGEFFPSTKDILNAKSKYWLPPTFGGMFACAGAGVPYVGPVFFYAPGIVIHMTETWVVAPVYDVVCMPYDLLKRPEYIQRERVKAEKWDAEKAVRSSLDNVLEDGRYLSPSNTVQRQALCDMLLSCPHDKLTAVQAERIGAFVRANPELAVEMCGISSQSRLPESDIEWFVSVAARLLRSEGKDDALKMSKSICRSMSISDRQYQILVDAGCPLGMVESSRKKRNAYKIQLAEELAQKEAARIRRAEELKWLKWIRKGREEQDRIRERHEERLRFTAAQIDAIRSAPEQFRDSLSYYDNVTIRKGWLSVIGERPLRPIPVENLMALYNVALTSTNFWSSSIVSAIHERPEMPVSFLESEYERLAERRWTTVSHVLKNPSFPQQNLEKAYVDPRIIGFRMQVAINPAFPWPNPTDRETFMKISGQLIEDKCRRKISEEELNSMLERLLREMQPKAMPAQWKQLL